VLEIDPILDLIALYGQRVYLSRPDPEPPADPDSNLPGDGGRTAWPVRGYVLDRESSLNVAGDRILAAGDLAGYIHGEDFPHPFPHDLRLYWEGRDYHVKLESTIGDLGRPLLVHVILKPVATRRAVAPPPVESAPDAWSAGAEPAPPPEPEPAPPPPPAPSPYQPYYNDGF